MLVRHLVQPSISLGSVIIKPSLKHAYTHLLCDLDRPVAAKRIQNDDVVRLTHRPDTVGKVAFFVQSQDKDRQAHHLDTVYPRRSGVMATADLSSCYGKIKRGTDLAVDQHSEHSGSCSLVRPSDNTDTALVGIQQ